MRPHARHLFALGGLTALAVAAWSDRDLFLAVASAPEAAAQLQSPRPRDAGQAARAAVAERWDQAAKTFANEVGVHLKHPRDGSSAEYRAARERAWPALRATLERAVHDLDAARALDPDDGAADVLAGFALLDLATWPARCSGEGRAAFGNQGDDPAGLGRSVQVRDPARLEEALARLERGLSRPRVVFSTPAGEGDDVTQGFGLHRLVRRLTGHAPANVWPALSLRDCTEALILLAHRQALTPDQGSPAHPLRLARRLGLRLGAEGTTLIDLMIGQALASTVARAWVFHAAEEGDGTLALAADQERLLLSRAFQRAQASPGVEVDRLGALDAVFVPLGGWSRERWDPSLGRRLEHATAEAMSLWLLLGAALVALALVALLQRSAPSATTAAGWTLGDLLGVVLGSVGLAAALLLALTRLHPARAFGDHGALTVHLLAALLFAVVALPLLLRRVTLAKHGLRPASPARARLGRWLLGAALVVATGWVGADEQGLAPLALALFLSGLATSAWSLRLGALPADVAASVRSYERRVAVSALGLSLVLLAAVDLALVRARRLALTDAYGDQVLTIAAQEAASWGSGELPATYAKLLRLAPDAPDLAALRPDAR
jgi:hypothetical protein